MPAYLPRTAGLDAHQSGDDCWPLFGCTAGEKHDCLLFQSSLRSSAHGTLWILA